MGKLFGSLCLSDIPRELIREGKNGKKYISIEVDERRTPSPYGDTHYVKAWCKAAERKEGVNYFIGELKPSKYDAPSAPAQPAPQPQVQAQDLLTQPAPDVDDVPF
jgi:hypothetical protein